MKNLFFSLAFMLIGSFAFASNSKQTTLSESFKAYDSYFIKSSNSLEKLVGTCYITIEFYDADGNLVGTRVIQINNVDSEAECDQFASDISTALGG